SLLPDLAATDDSLLDSVESDDERCGAVLGARFQGDRFELLGVGRKLVLLARHLCRYLRGCTLWRPHRKPLQPLLGAVVALLIGGQRPRIHRRQKFVPDQVQNRLHVLDATGDGDHRILLGQDDAVLPECAIAPVGTMARAPELVAVTLVPITLRIATV